MYKLRRDEALCSHRTLTFQLLINIELSQLYFHQIEKKFIQYKTIIKFKKFELHRYSFDHRISSAVCSASTSCRREAAKICLRPGLQVVTRYIIHAYGSVTNSMSMLACQYRQPTRPGDLDLWPLTFWLWKWCPSHVWCGLPLKNKLK